MADGALFGAFAAFGAGSFFGPGDLVFAIFTLLVGVASGLDGHGIFLTADFAGLFCRASFGAGSRFDDFGLGLISGVFGFVDYTAIASLTFVPVIVIVGFPLGAFGSFVLVVFGGASVWLAVTSTGS